MKRRGLCVFSFVVYILAMCTLLSAKIEDTMMTRVESGPVNTRAAHESVIRELPDRALFADNAGLHLYEIYDGTGWESGKRIREVSGWTLGGDGTVRVPGYPDTAYVFSASRQPKQGEEVKALETWEKGDDLCLALFSRGTPDIEALELPQNIEISAFGGQAMLLEVTEFPMPFMEQCAKTAASGLRAADRIFSIGDAQRFLAQIPALAKQGSVLAIGVVLLFSTWIFAEKSRGIAWLNGALAVFSLGLVPFLLKGMDIPVSLLPDENIFRFSHYRERFAQLFFGLGAFPETLQELTERKALALAQGRSILLLGAAFLMLVLILEGCLAYAFSHRRGSVEKTVERPRNSRL